MTRAYDHKELHGGASFPMIGEGLFLYTTTDGEVIGVSLPSLSFSRFTQPTPSSRWHFIHDLGYLPLVQVYDETGHIITESVHVSVTNTTVTVETENGVLVGGYLTLMGASGSSGGGAEYVKLSDLGNYALVSALNTAVSTLQTEIDGKQSAGNYVLQQAFASTISSLQTAVDGKQSAGEYARLVQGVIPTSQLPNDWLINTTAVGSDTEMLALTQFRRGDFVWRSDQNAYYDLNGNDPTVIGNWQRRIQSALRSVNGQAGPDVVLGHGDVGAAPAGDYALNSALANYVLTAAFNQSVATLQTAINGKQNTGDYALNSALANYVLTAAFNQAVATLQAAINAKQDAGSYALNATLANYALLSQIKTRLLNTLTLHVSPTGTDSPTGGTQAAPFRTLSFAWFYIARYIDPSDFTVTISLADGSYGTGTLVGLNNVSVVGNTTNPDNVKITNANGTPTFDRCNNLTINGVNFANPIVIQNYARVTINNCIFDGPGSGLIVTLQNHARAAFSNITVRGGAFSFMTAQDGCTASIGSVTIQNSPNFTGAFAVVDFSKVTFTTAFSVPSGTITGSRASITNCGVALNLANLPATMTAATVSRGGQQS
jgi:hypothetical protein